MFGGSLHSSSLNSSGSLNHTLIVCSFISILCFLFCQFLICLPHSRACHVPFPPFRPFDKSTNFRLVGMPLHGDARDMRWLSGRGIGTDPISLIPASIT